MQSTAFTTLLGCSSQSIGVLAEVGTRVLDEGGIGAALLLSLAGIGLRAYVPHHQMASEEKVKDGTLTPAEARRRNRFLETSAATVTLIGVGVLGWVLVELAW